VCGGECVAASVMLVLAPPPMSAFRVEITSFHLFCHNNYCSYLALTLSSADCCLLTHSSVHPWLPLPNP